MNFDKKTMLLIAFFFVGIAGYNYYLQVKYPEYFQQQMTESIQESEGIVPEEPKSPVPRRGDTNGSADTADETASESDATNSQPLLTNEELRFETDERIIVFDQRSSSISSIILKNYFQTRDRVRPVELLDTPMVMQGVIDPNERTMGRDFEGVREGNKIRFSRTDGAFRITQEFNVPETGYGLGLKVSFENLSDKSLELNAGLLSLTDVILPEDSGGFGPAAMMALHKSFIVSIDGSRDDEIAVDHCEEPDELAFDLKNELVDFIGYDNHYFLSVIHPTEEKVNFTMGALRPARSLICTMALVSNQRQGLVEPGQIVNLEFSGYFGPKDLDILDSHGQEFVNTVKFGWFSIIAKPLLAAVKILYGLVQNYGIAIMLVTIVLKILFYPLTKAAAVSMKRMQKLQPEMTRIREKYKSDPQKQQRELMAFMSKNKVNPAKGCLPILPQIPVFIAFYNVLSQAIELRHAPFFGWIQDLSIADPYYVTPLLLGVGMFVQQKQTPNPSMDKNQEKIMLMMPIIFTVLMLSLPAGMVLYMITNTAVSILQQQWLNRKLEKQFG